MYYFVIGSLIVLCFLTSVTRQPGDWTKGIAGEVTQAPVECTRPQPGNGGGAGGGPLLTPCSQTRRQRARANMLRHRCFLSGRCAARRSYGALDCPPRPRSAVCTAGGNRARWREWRQFATEGRASRHLLFRWGAPCSEASEAPARGEGPIHSSGTKRHPAASRDARSGTWPGGAKRPQRRGRPNHRQNCRQLQTPSEPPPKRARNGFLNRRKNRKKTKKKHKQKPKKTTQETRSCVVP